jgi:cytochrome d ubiquinol oxidase subunit I
MEGLYLKTKREVYKDMTRFWIKIFALIFGLGVATGIIMEFEFGTNWATYSKYVGDVFGSALARRRHFCFCYRKWFPWYIDLWLEQGKFNGAFYFSRMVFLGSLFSAVWIVVANSWQQTPAGFHIVGEGLNARAEITDFGQWCLNPSSMQRLTHVWIGAFLAGAFLVLSVNAYYILKQRHLDIAKPSFKIALAVATFFSLTQLVAGGRSAEGVAKNQPAKLAAMEGHYDSSAVAPCTCLDGLIMKNSKRPA